MTSRQNGGRLHIFLFLVLAMGCDQAPPAIFQLSEGAQKLPEAQQAMIRTGLEQLFGTPQAPRALTRATTAEESASEGDDDEGAEGATSTPPALVDVMDRERLTHGAQVYRMRCSGCHGVTGDGQGLAAAYLRPKPRDYRKGVFKFTSTPYGSKPARQDLVRIIRQGAKGTSMPSFPFMAEDDLQSVIDYVIYLSQRGEVETAVAQVAELDYDEEDPIPLDEFIVAFDDIRARWDQAASQITQPVSVAPPFNSESVKKGRELFLSQNCYKCHGELAEGQTEWLSQAFLDAQASRPEAERVQINFDQWGQPAPAADLTARMLHGGRSDIDIYRRIYSGINGTPMPGFADLFKDSPDSIWHLVHYVRHIVEGGDPKGP